MCLHMNPAINPRASNVQGLETLTECNWDQHMAYPPLLSKHLSPALDRRWGRDVMLLVSLAFGRMILFEDILPFLNYFISLDFSNYFPERRSKSSFWMKAFFKWHSSITIYSEFRYFGFLERPGMGLEMLKCCLAFATHFYLVSTIWYCCLCFGVHIPDYLTY